MIIKQIYDQEEARSVIEAEGNPATSRHRSSDPQFTLGEALRHRSFWLLSVAMALRPSVLLLDEPAEGVPTGESAVILDALGRLPPEIAVLLIEHDMDIVFRFAQRITVLDRGQLLVEGTPDEIAANDEVRRIYFGEADLPVHA